MNTVRYILAVIMLVGVSYAIPYWFIVHPFVRFWRRLGPRLAYSLLTVISLGLGVSAFLLRDRILTVDYGTSIPLIVVGVICYFIAIAIQLRVKRYLKFRILAGVPELESGGKGGTLLQEGIYARVRHPRYVSFMFGMLAIAFFTNYLAMYILIPLSAAALYLVVLLEERELRNRFGGDYVRYSERVPRFIPRLRENQSTTL
jgi:protein-S-isoprenylcysteine O-methyltransferase Ste14